MATFELDLESAKKYSEDRYRDYLRNNFSDSFCTYSTEEFTSLFKSNKINIYLCDTVIMMADGSIQTIENKYDIASVKTGNIFLEFTNETYSRNIGIAKEVDWVVYNFPQDPHFYRFKPKEMMKFLFERPCQTRLTSRDPRCKSHGVLLPLSEFLCLEFVKKQGNKTGPLSLSVDRGNPLTRGDARTR